MACFLVPTAEAIITAVAAKASKSSEEKNLEKISVEGAGEEIVEPKPIPFSRKLKWLTYMLLGGAVLLAFEHVWHGEVVPWPPFLTAASNPADTAEMLHEMSTVGVTMAIIITVVWIGMVVVSSIMTKKAMREFEEKKSQAKAN
jgi:hypothetical protein